MSGIADRIAGLGPEQRALFEQLRRRQQEAAQALRPPPVPPVSGPTGEGDWPLSLDQERFWFMEQLYPGHAGLNLTAATRMGGPLSVPALAAALAAIVARHAAWRTVFPVAGGRPLQRVLAERRQPLPIVDLAALPRAVRETLALRLAGADSAAPLDVERGPLVRSCLLRLGFEDHLCVLTVHHLVTDWLSFHIAWGELAALYDALLAGRSPRLPAPPLHYPDFALWQRRWLEGSTLATLVSWWREQLSGVPLVLDLPTDRPRQAVPRTRGGRRAVVLPAATAAGLRALARGEGATPFMAVLAAFAALVHRDSGQERLILGANNANRIRPELEAVLGCFLTQVPFAIDLAGDPSWRQLLARARGAALGAFAHQDLPFGKLVEALQPERDTGRQPLVQALVQVLDGQYSKAGLAGIACESVDVFDGRSRYDLMLSLIDHAAAAPGAASAARTLGTPEPGSLSGSLDYDSDLFDAATAERQVERLLLQVAAAVADPDAPLSALPVLSAAGRHQVLHEWNDTARPLPTWTVPERVAVQAACTPAAVAVVAGGRALSYGELERRAGELAARLRAAGVGVESRVALLLGRTLDVPLVMLAVWKAGGAFVPLDPDAPAARLLALLADAEPALLVHRGPLPFTPARGFHALDLDAAVLPPAAASGAPAAADLPGARPERLAYLIYTSGTTGRPKAVAVEHGSLAAVLAAFAGYLRLAPGDRVPNLARHSFDAALGDLFAPLLVGAQCEIAGSDELLDPPSLLALLARSTVLLFGPPALLRQAAATVRESAAAERFAELAAINTGAELVPPALQEQLLAAFPASELHVMYGPTETTIVCTGLHIGRHLRPARALIGWPLSGCEVRVVDRRLGGGASGALVPPGVPGELWIAGRGVARGYFRRDELTAERFVTVAGRRFYRTGDLVRQVAAAGGALEFLGRTDDQVKVRGFRVEPGEIEAALAAHPAVREAAVAARPDAAGDNQLIAWYVPAGAGAPAADLHAHLAAGLPLYMVPSAFIAVPQLPRSAHGKVDRGRLLAALPPAGGGPAPGAMNGNRTAVGSAGSAAAAPANALGAGTQDRPLEELVAGIWCQVLDLPGVARHASFFELGGHSLLATQVISRLRAATGAELPVRAISRAPTVAALAAAVAAALAARQQDGLPAPPPLGRAVRPAELPLSFAQERLWFLDRLAPGGSAYNIPVALVARGDLSLRALAAALAAIVLRHEVLRTVYPMPGVPASGGVPRKEARPVQVVEPPATRVLPVVDLMALPAGTRAAVARRLAGAEAVRPFDLERGPVLRQLAIRLAADEHALLLVAHHIAADGWSVGVMVDELSALYRAAVAGVAAVAALAAITASAAPAAAAGAGGPAEDPTGGLPRLPVQYADFALWQRGWLQGAALDRQLDYWRRQLAGVPALDLPIDRPRPPMQSYRGRTRLHAVAAPLAHALTAQARRADATLFMLLLAAVQALLGRWAGQDDVVLGSPIANRTRAEIEPLIGFFVNTLVLRGDLAGDPPFAELQARARRAALDAYSFQDLPFERLVEELRPERRLAHNPLFQVMFAVQNTPLRPIALPGVTLAPLEIGSPSTRFDLEIFFTEVADGLAVQLTWSTDLFDAPTALRLLGRLEALLAAVAADPMRRLAGLDLLPAAERHQLLAEWNDTAAALPERGIAALFAEQVQRRPDAVAVSAEEGELTYGELAAWAARLAHRLAAAGVGPEVRVALLARRSPALVAAVIAILAAGGAYVPLDPADPAARLAWLLADSGASVLLGDPELLAGLPPEVGAPVVLALAAARPALGPPGGGARDALAAAGDDPGRLAYVMYTSGSTGSPKGVGVSQRAIVRLVRASGFADLGPRQVFLQLAPLSFDASTLEIWAPLLNGGRLALFPRRRPSLQDLAAALWRFRVTTLWLTAGLFHAVVEEQPAALSSLGQLLAGGDVLSPAQVRRALAAVPGVTLVNGYGPTEVTTFSCCHAIRDAAAIGATVPLGRPIGNTRVQVLGPDQEPVPAGAWGELWAGGDGLARGYVGRPDLTADRFRPDPFAPPGSTGSRLYRTGDVVRRTGGGLVEFRGRRDGQVKLRGFRVELGEVESALRDHPRVGAAAVVAREEPGAAGRRLVGYVVPHAAATPAGLPAADDAAGPARRRIEQWRELYDQTYARRLPEEAAGDAAFNVQGWHSSYTGEPIPVAEMREWLDGVAGRVLALPHRRVLEVGCGTGLVLFRVAPGAERYRGTDFSAVALAQVHAEASRRGLANVELDQRPADDWNGIAPGDFDLVVLNSVIQYFPGIDYLLRVLARAVATVAATADPARAAGGGTGAVFVGDVRSLPLLPAFHASVELARASGSLPAAELARRVRRRVAQEEELVIDPAFFHALAHRWPAIRRVEVQLKRGRHANELTCFRYDVVLHVGPPAPAAAPAVMAGGAAAPVRRLQWEADGLTLAALERILRGGAERGRDAAGAAAAVAVAGIPNARLAAAGAARELLTGGGWEIEEMETVAELRAEIDRRAAAASRDAIDPQELWSLAERLGWAAEVAWPGATGGADGRMEAVFRQPRPAPAAAAPAGIAVPGLIGLGETAAPAAAPAVTAGTPETVWSAWANDPLRAGEERQLVPELRRFLAERLPEHMVPAALVVLDALPLTPNGKLDRAALPAPERPAPAAGGRAAPETPLEQLLAGVAAELLGVEDVSLRDNFFALGGHSLLATQLVSRLGQEHGLPVTLQMVFDAPDLGGLADRIVDRELAEADATLLDDALRELEQA